MANTVIYKIRAAGQMSQKEFGASIGVHERHVGRVENDAAHAVGWEMALSVWRNHRDLMVLLGLDLESILAANLAPRLSDEERDRMLDPQENAGL